MLIRAVAKRGGTSLDAAWAFLGGCDPAYIHLMRQESLAWWYTGEAEAAL